MQLKRVPIDQLESSAYNPRVTLKPGDPTYEKLKLSIEAFGCVQPVVVNRRTGYVVGGHQRLTVLRDLGHTEVDVLYVDLPLDREKALNIALNKIVGEWDEPKLALLLEEIDTFADVDVDLTGFESGEITELLDRVIDQEGVDNDFDFEASLDTRGPAVTQPGELLELGQHRLLCGDCTDVKVVRELMNGQRAALFATDPPYLVGYDGTNHPGSKKPKRKTKTKSGGNSDGKRGGKSGGGGGGSGGNKDWSGSYGVTWDDADANPDLYENFIRVAIDAAIVPNAAWYCWHASRRQAMLEEVWQKFGAFVHQQIIWVKDRPILSRSWYSWQHEPCFFGWVRTKQPPRIADDHLSTTWQIPTTKVGEKTDHPTSKPVEVFAIPMRQHTNRGDICYEPFCGSGSQLIAAETLGRRCFALEISPHYCDVIVRRWLHFVGKQHAPADLARRYAVRVGEGVVS